MPPLPCECVILYGFVVAAVNGVDFAVAMPRRWRDGDDQSNERTDRSSRTLNPEEPGSIRGASGDHACSVSDGHASLRLNPAALGVPAVIGVLAAAILLSFYFGVLMLVSGWSFTLQQFDDYWPFIVALAIGFGIQVGLFVYLRRAIHSAASGKIVAATGATSGAAMVSCCTHYLVNLLPALGATGLVSFVGQYQVELFWFGLAANLAGIAYIGRRLVSFAHGA